MTTAAMLLSTAERCEREEPSPYLASAILVSCGHQTLFRGEKLGWEWRENGVGVWSRMPRPDTSLDAAVTLLMPDQAWYVGRTIATHMARAHYSIEGFCTVGSKTVKPKTPALALCAAALRSRAALKAEG